jgi:hypothetical protein
LENGERRTAFPDARTARFLVAQVHLRPRDESRYRAIQRKLVPAASGESVRPAPTPHETTIFEPAQGRKEAPITDLPSERGRVWMPHHQ